MALTDFFSEGDQIPAGSAVTSTVSTAAPAGWINDTLKKILADQNAVGGATFSEYTGPRVAPFSPDTVNSFAKTREAVDAYKPGLEAATATAGKAAGTSGAAAAQPGMTEAANTYRGALDQPGAADAANPYLTAGGKTVEGALAKPGAAASAQPFLDKATGGVANVDEYMNPYQQQVVDRIGELGNRNLLEKIMPGLEGRYIKAGQFRGSGQMTDTARAVRDTQEGISAAQGAALASGYTSAQTAKGSDLTREGNLAATAGNAANADRTTDVNAAAVQGNLGETAGNAANTDRTTTANIAQGQGNLANQQGNLTVSDAANLNNTATVQGGLAEKAQSLGIAGADALDKSGIQQEGKTKEQIDVDYGNYLREKGYPQEQIDAALKTVTAVAGVGPKVATKEGIEPIGTNTGYSPSTTDKIGGAIAGGGAILDAIKDFNKP